MPKKPAALNQQLKKYFSDKGISTKSYINYISDINQFLKWLSANYPGSSSYPKINKHHVASYKALLVAERKTLKSINRKLSSLRHFAEFLKEKRYQKGDFMNDIGNVSLLSSIDDVTNPRPFVVPVLFTAIIAIAFIALLENQRTNKYEGLYNSLLEKYSTSSDQVAPLEFKVNSEKVPATFTKLDNFQISVDENVSSLPTTSSQDIVFSLPNENSTSEFNYSLSGDAILEKGKTEKTIDNSFISKNARITLTPKSSTNNKVLFIKSIEDGKFIVAINEPINENIVFNWIAQ